MSALRCLEASDSDGARKYIGAAAEREHAEAQMTLGSKYWMHGASSPAPAQPTPMRDAVPLRRCRGTWSGELHTILCRPPPNELTTWDLDLGGFRSPATHGSHIAHDGHPELRGCNARSLDPIAPP